MEMQLENTPVPQANPPVSRTQPVQALANLDPMLDETAVRQALAFAEANNQDPLSVTMQDLAQVSFPNPDSAMAQPRPIEVPQKFLKPDGAVDVDKIQASTKALDEAIAKKEEATTKTVDDYMREYAERETKFRTMPNPERLAANLPVQSLPPAQTVPPQQFEDIVRRDYQQDPLMTTTRLIDIALAQRFAPLEEKQKVDSVRSNIQALAEKDPRILRQDVFDAIKAKIASDPDIASRKNPHKAAWLEVKEEMRLGESSQVQTQPSRLSPVLGGGTPPSAPSSSAPTSQSVLGNLHSLDLRDKRQEALGDEAIRQALMGERR